MRAVGTRRDVACEISSFGGFGAWRAQRRIENASRIVAAEPKELDRLEGGGAAGATEATPGRRRRPAMLTGAIGDGGLRAESATPRATDVTAR